MRATRLAIVTILPLIGAFTADAAPLKPELAGLAFLVGSWSAGNGHVADTGGTSKGVSTITSELAGALLLRRDHTDLFDKAGKPAGGFDQIMTIYAESGTVRADYFDGTHVIHYMSASIVPGRSVSFATAPAPGVPAFRLTYDIKGEVLGVAFAMAPPGQVSFHPIATGTLHKAE